MFDEEGRKIKIQEFPRNLEGLSVADIEDYIADLKAEMVRCEADAKAKKASIDAAANIFK